MQDFSAAEFGSLPLPESIRFEDDPGFGLELGLRPCASLEPGDGPMPHALCPMLYAALHSAQYPGNFQVVSLPKKLQACLHV